MLRYMFLQPIRIEPRQNQRKTDADQKDGAQAVFPDECSPFLRPPACGKDSVFRQTYRFGRSRSSNSSGGSGLQPLDHMVEQAAKGVVREVGGKLVAYHCGAPIEQSYGAFRARKPELDPWCPIGPNHENHALAADVVLSLGVVYRLRSNLEIGAERLDGTRLAACPHRFLQNRLNSLIDYFRNGNAVERYISISARKVHKAEERAITIHDHTSMERQTLLVDHMPKGMTKCQG